MIDRVGTASHTYHSSNTAGTKDARSAPQLSRAASYSAPGGSTGLPAPSPITRVPQALAAMGLAAEPTRYPRLAVALQDTLDSTPAAETQALLNAARRLGRPALNDLGWVQLLHTLENLQARLKEAKWNAMLDVVERSVRATPRIGDWSVALNTLASMDRNDAEYCVQAAELLGRAGWPLDDIAQVVDAAFNAHTREHWTALLDGLRVLCEGSNQTAQRLALAEELCMIEPQVWTRLASATQTLCTGMGLQGSRVLVTRALAHAYQTNRPAHRPSLLSASMRLCTQRMTAEQRATIVRVVATVPFDERDALAALCVPLRDTGINFDQFVAYVNTMADTPASARRRHRENLLRQAEGLARAAHHGRDPYHVDVENVAVYARVSKAAASIEGLLASDRSRGLVAELDDLRGYIRRLREDPHVNPALLRTRARRAEILNALHALDGPRRYEDFSGPVSSNPTYHYGAQAVGLGDLCAVVWAAIRHHRASSGNNEDSHRERQNLRISLVLALAQCIEDDGHRVCPVGVSQRLLQVLQGYHPAVHLDTATPQTLLATLTQAFSAPYDLTDAAPDAAAIAAFAREAEANALEHFAQGSNDHQVFMRDLLAYLQITYEWHP